MVDQAEPEHHSGSRLGGSLLIVGDQAEARACNSQQPTASSDRPEPQLPSYRYDRLLTPRRRDVVAARVGDELTEVLVQVGVSRYPHGAGGGLLAEDFERRRRACRRTRSPIDFFRNANDFSTSAMISSRRHLLLLERGRGLVVLAGDPGLGRGVVPIAAGMK